ncbi:MAG: ATP phosphoribosyltransferase [Patescibacteria group bacterium]
MEQERLKCALPKGELEKDVLSFIQSIGIDTSASKRNYLVRADNFPVDFVLIRASDVPRFVQDKASSLKFGITGSDIIWESGMGKDSGEEIPIYELNPDAKKSSLYLGVTQLFKRYLQRIDVEIQDLQNSRVATKLPRIAGEYFTKKGIETKLLFVPGADEAMQYLFPDCNAILGVISSGETARANNIDVLDIFYDVSLRFIADADKMTPIDVNILNEFREKIAVARERKRML